MISAERCIIFDLDGTLVDSEGLGAQAFLDLLPDLALTLDVLVSRFKGLKMEETFRAVAVELGRELPEGFESQYRERVSERFERELVLQPGVRDLLGALEHPCCVASNAPAAKIHHALRLTGIDAHFGAGVFSAYDVGAWKPDPRLFRHAAAQMGFDASRRIVIEDAEVGVQAALAAGMRVCHYRGEPGSAAGAPSRVFQHMHELPSLLRAMR